MEFKLESLFDESFAKSFWMTRQGVDDDEGPSLRDSFLRSEIPRPHDDDRHPLTDQQPRHSHHTFPQSDHDRMNEFEHVSRQMEASFNHMLSMMMGARMDNSGLFPGFGFGDVPVGSSWGPTSAMNEQTTVSSSSSSSSVFRMLPDGSTERTTRRYLSNGDEEVEVVKCDPMQVCETMRKWIRADGKVIEQSGAGDTGCSSLRDDLIKENEEDDLMKSVNVPLEKSGFTPRRWWPF